MIEDIQQTRFENGLVVLSDRMTPVRSATLGFFYRTGAQNEPRELNGISHFIEHTVFKGTQRRSALDIAIEQDRLGGNLEAFTTHEETAFAIKVIDDQLEAAFDLMADMLVNPAFDQKELDSEQRVIIEEMKMTDDSPEEFLSELFDREIYAEHPLGRRIAGTPESVRTFERELTRSYHHEHFGPENLVLVAAGNVEHERLLDLVDHLSSMPRTGVAGKDVCPPSVAVPIVVHQKPDLEQAHLLIGLPFVNAKSDKRYAADLLTNIIGGGMSSRLWQKIREERGLAYSVGASNVMYHTTGLFTIFAGTSPEQVGEVVDISIDELRNVSANGVSDRELELAKHQARSSVLLNLEDSAARAAALAQSEMTFGRQISVEETLRNIEVVTQDDLAKLANHYLATESVAFAAIGDLHDLKIDRERLKTS
jgi:predicted Zn-dependent peptidase